MNDVRGEVARDKEGKIQMIKPLVMSCQTPVQEGMVVLSETERVQEHRCSVMELLLIKIIPAK